MLNQISDRLMVAETMHMCAKLCFVLECVLHLRQALGLNLHAVWCRTCVLALSISAQELGVVVYAGE